ncbi:MAG TPA: hypothetical protein ENI23_02420 [bacterium]|nr:hypothetical protein [bacterium]
MKKRQEVYDTYWKFAAERQNIFFKRLRGRRAGLTKDSILREYKFCNVYRASDRVSQYLIKEVIYSSDFKPEDLLFRIFFFRLLNKIETWEKLKLDLGEPLLSNFSFARYSSLLSKYKEDGPIYGNAFILAAHKAFGHEKKHENHLALIEHILNSSEGKRILNSQSLEELFTNLIRLPLIGNFMGYQIAIDLNYSELFDFSEDDFTVPGPGAKRGIRKAFESLGDKDEEYVIHYMVDNQEKEFERLGIEFKDLFGRRLHAIDCQGLFCEADKYSRVKFPNLKSNRVRIKSKFTPKKNKIEYFYPPKWWVNKHIR